MGAGPLAQFLTFLLDPVSGGRSPGREGREMQGVRFQMADSALLVDSVWISFTTTEYTYPPPEEARLDVREQGGAAAMTRFDL